MGFSSGIIGLPNVGKTTIFNALSGARARVASYPFTTVEPNHGIVPVPDPRLLRIAAIMHKARPIATTIELIDIAGLVKGSSRGEGLGNEFLGHIRGVDALVHVVRCFENDDARHMMGKVDPVRDMEIIATELALADMEHLGRERQKLAARAPGRDQEAQARREIIEPMLQHLCRGEPLRRMALTPAMQGLARQYGLITAKPMLYCVNVDETGLAAARREDLEARAASEGTDLLAIHGKIEAEIAELDGEEKQRYLEGMGLSQSGLDALARAAYRLLGLLTFYTATTELQAWTIPWGTVARAAARRIHTDFDRGFIRAEVMSCEDLVRAGSEQQARAMGLVRAEGQEYVVRDGDIVHFLFNV